MIEPFRAGGCFASVNRAGRPGYVEGMERHHLVVTQCLRDAGLRRFFAELAPFGFRLNDFATNGVLLPSFASLSDRLALPVHRGPHPHYSEQVIAQVRRIADGSRWIDGPRLRARFAIGALRTLQRRLRSGIVQHGAGSIDTVIIGWRTDLDIDAAVDALLAAKARSGAERCFAAGAADTACKGDESGVCHRKLSRI